MIIEKISSKTNRKCLATIFDHLWKSYVELRRYSRHYKTAEKSHSTKLKAKSIAALEIYFSKQKKVNNYFVFHL